MSQVPYRLRYAARRTKTYNRTCIFEQKNSPYKINIEILIKTIYMFQDIVVSYSLSVCRAPDKKG